VWWRGLKTEKDTHAECKIKKKKSKDFQILRFHPCQHMTPNYLHFSYVVSSLFIHPILNVLWVVFKFTLYLNSGVVAFLSWILHKAFCSQSKFSHKKESLSWQPQLLKNYRLKDLCLHSYLFSLVFCEDEHDLWDIGDDTNLVEAMADSAVLYMCGPSLAKTNQTPRTRLPSGSHQSAAFIWTNFKWQEQIN